MSMKTTLIWIIIAGLLAAGALTIRRYQHSHTQNTQPQWSQIGIDPVSVESVSISGPSGQQTLQRDPETIDSWTLSWGSAEDTTQWNAQPVRVRGALRSLSTTKVRLNDDELFEQEETRIVLKMHNGYSATISFGPQRSAGRAPIKVEHRDESGAISRVIRGWVDASVPTAFSPSAVMSWRNDHLFPFLTSEVSELKLTAGANSVTLQRGSTGWRISDPYSIHADPIAVERVIKSLLAIEASAFIDEPATDGSDGLANPIANIELSNGSQSRTLLVGERADVQGSTLYSKLISTSGSVLATISTEDLSDLTAVPDAYIAKTPAMLARTAVRALSISGIDGKERLLARRTPDGWSINAKPADSLNRDSVERILDLVLSTPATAVRVIDQTTTDLKPVARVSLIGADQQVLFQATASLEQGNSGMQLLLSKPLDDARQVVWATSGDEAAASGAWLTAVASRRAPID